MCRPPLLHAHPAGFATGLMSEAFSATLSIDELPAAKK